jgi:hypothetical protein
MPQAALTVGPGSSSLGQKISGCLGGLEADSCCIVQCCFQAKTLFEVVVQSLVKGFESIKHGFVPQGGLPKGADCQQCRFDRCFHLLVYGTIRDPRQALTGRQQCTTPEGAGRPAAMVRPSFAGFHQHFTGFAVLSKGGMGCCGGSPDPAHHAEAVVTISGDGIQCTEFLLPLTEGLFNRSEARQQHPPRRG